MNENRSKAPATIVAALGLLAASLGVSASPALADNQTGVSTGKAILPDPNEHKRIAPTVMAHAHKGGHRGKFHANHLKFHASHAKHHVYHEAITQKGREK